MSWLGCPVLGLRQTSIADMRLVNCYSRSVLGPSSLPSQFTELFGMGVKEAEAVLYGRCSAADSAFVSAEHRAWVRRFIGWPITKPTKRALKTCHTGVERQQGLECDRLSLEKLGQHSLPRI